MQQLTEKERSLEAELEEANKQVRALKEDADNLKDTETVEAQHVQVGRLVCDASFSKLLQISRQHKHTVEHRMLG